MNQTSRPRFQKSLLASFAGSILALCSSTQAAVIVTFEQVGPDVVATLKGDITLGTYTASDSATWLATNTSKNSLGPSQSLIMSGHPNNPGAFFVGGTATVTTLVSHPTSGTSITNQGPGQPFPVGFGFVGSTFTVPNFQSSPSSYFSFDGPITYFMTWTNSTLSGIGAASFNNTLAWTSSAGGTNTVSYTTVPEPTAALLGLLGGVCMLRRRMS